MVFCPAYKVKPLLTASIITFAAISPIHALTFGVDPGVAAIASTAQNITPTTSATRRLAAELNFAGTPISLLGGTGDPSALTIVAGGGANDSSVTYLYTAGTNDSSIGFVMPVEVNNCPADDAEITVSIVIDTSNTPVETNNPVSAPAGITCGQAFTFDTELTAFSNILQGDPNFLGPSESFIALPDYTTLTSMGVGNAVTSPDTTIGVYRFSVDTTLHETLASATDTVDTTDAMQLVYDVVFEDSTGLYQVQDGFGTIGTFVIINQTDVNSLDDPNAASISITNSSPRPLVGTHFLNLHAPEAVDREPIIGQSIMARNIILELASNYIAPTFADRALNTLAREGRSFGPFKWNSENGQVNSIYRITGLSTTEDTPMTITYSNTREGGIYNRTINTSVNTNDITNGGEYVITARGRLSDMNPGYTRGDVSFFFETPDLIEVSRLISSGGSVGDFGDQK